MSCMTMMQITLIIHISNNGCFLAMFRKQKEAYRDKVSNVASSKKDYILLKKRAKKY